jgi:hypothetical protein
MPCNVELDPALFGRLALAGFELELPAPAGATSAALRDEWLEAVRVLKEMAGASAAPWEAALSELRALRPPPDGRNPVYPRAEQLLMDALKERTGPPELAHHCLAQIVSLVSLCPTYCIDAGPLNGALLLRRVAPGETGRLAGQNVPLDDYAVLADAESALVTPTRQYDHGNPDSAAARLLLVIFAPQAGARLQRALALAGDLAARHLGTAPGHAFKAGI